MMTQRSPSWHARLRGYVLLPHAVPIVVVMGATAALALIAAGGWPGAGAIARLLGAMLGGQLAIGAINELVDIELDRVANPHKPLAAGLASERGAWTMAVAGAVGMVLLSATFGGVSLLLCSLGTGTGVAYSLWFKRTVWSWVPYVIALPLLPLWVWASLDAVPPGMWAVYPIGLPAVVAVQIAQSLPDVEGDRRNGVRTLAVALGGGRARWLCWTAMTLAAGLAAAMGPLLTSQPGWVWGACALAGALVAVNWVIWLRDHRAGEMACFPCVASAAAVLGIGWAAALVG